MKKKRVSPSKDPAVIALNRVMAARTDAQYDVAIAELETCPALTPQGVRAKRNLGARDRLVLASGGVARDFLTIFGQSLVVAVYLLRSSMYAS